MRGLRGNHRRINPPSGRKRHAGVLRVLKLARRRWLAVTSGVRGLDDRRDHDHRAATQHRAPFRTPEPWHRDHKGRSRMACRGGIRVAGSPRVRMVRPCGRHNKMSYKISCDIKCHH